MIKKYFESQKRPGLRYDFLTNTLTHEYPDNEDEIIEGIKLALIAFNEITKIYDNIKFNYIHLFLRILIIIIIIINTHNKKNKT